MKIELTVLVFLPSFARLSHVLMIIHFGRMRNGAQRLQSTFSRDLLRFHLQQFALVYFGNVVSGKTLHNARMFLLNRTNQQFGAIRSHRSIETRIDAVDQPIDRRCRISFGHAIQFETLAFVGQCVNWTMQNGWCFQNFQANRMHQYGRNAIVQPAHVRTAIFAAHIQNLQTIAEHRRPIVRDRCFGSTPNSFWHRRTDARAFKYGCCARFDGHKRWWCHQERRRSAYFAHTDYEFLWHFHLGRSNRIHCGARVCASIGWRHRLQN